MTNEKRKVILVVDDDDTLRGRMEISLSRRGYEVCCAANYDEAVQMATERQPDLAVLDLKMPGMSGLDLLTTFAKISPATRAVILTGYGSITNAVEAIKLGAVNYVTKPADADQVLAALEENLEDDHADDRFTPPSLATAQWDHIQRVLASCDGNISEAARQLDIPRRTLQRKLKKLAP